MQAEPRLGRHGPSGLHAAADGPGVGDPDRVGQRDLVHAKIGDPAHDGGQAPLRNLPVKRTTEGDGYGGGHGRTLGAVALHHLGQEIELLVGRGSLIAHAKALRGADHHIGFVAACAHAALPAAHVENKADAPHALGRRGQSGHHLLRMRHLRHPAVIDEGDRLDAAHACGLELRDERDPVGDGEGPRLVLQSVPRADFDDLDMTGHARALPLAFRAGFRSRARASA